MLRIVAVIPARYASTRFPGKPLALLAGKPMVEHVYRRAAGARSVSGVVVATDDERVASVVRAFGGHPILTRPEHQSGTERIAEVAARLEADVYVNVQGDEPLLESAAIDAAVGAVVEDRSVRVSTLCVSIRNPQDILDPNVVKVVTRLDGNALYFSRSPLPWVRDENPAAWLAQRRHFKHLGLYVYRRDALLEFAALPLGQLERLERLEQLRFLENGIPIRVVETERDSLGVDTPEDLARVEAILRRG